jgi:hypothetical protein
VFFREATSIGGVIVPSVDNIAEYAN